MTSFTWQPGDPIYYYRTERDGGQTWQAAVVVDVDPKRKRIGIAVRDFETDPVTGKWWWYWEPKRVDPKNVGSRNSP